MQQVIYIFSMLLCLSMICGCEDRTPAVAPVPVTATDKPASTQETPSSEPVSPTPGSGEVENVVEADSDSAVEAVLDEALGGRKKAIVFFRKDNPKTTVMAKSFEEMERKLGEKALFLAVDADDPKEATVVQKYQINQLPEPVILIFSPQGMVLSGFKGTPEFSVVEKVVASQALSDFVYALSNANLVFVVVGKPDSDEFKDVIGVTQKYAKLAGQKEITIQVNIFDPSEKIMLESLKIEENESKTVTGVVFAGRLAGKLSGKITTAQIQRLLDSCAAGCASG